MKVKVSMVVNIEDDLHPDAAAAIIDMALCGHKSKFVRNWHTTEIVELKTCPMCDGCIPNDEQPGAYPGAISRKDNATEICSECGLQEALEDFANQKFKSMGMQ